MPHPFAWPRSPFDLAMARFAVFGALLARAETPLFALVCALGFVGASTRVAGWVAVALAFPSVEPLGWAAALLAVAPSAEVLAFDGIPDAWRRGDARRTAPPDASAAYGAALATLVVFALAGRSPWLLAALVPWAWGFRRLGAAIFRTPLAIMYDGECGFCRRAIATLRTLDVLERIDWTDSTDSERVRALGLTAVADGADLVHFTAVFPGGTAWGYDAYRRLAARIPFFLPVLPLLGLPPVVALGRAVYGRVEASRPAINPEPMPPRAAPTRLGVGLVGAGVLLFEIVRLAQGG